MKKSLFVTITALFFAVALTLSCMAAAFVPSIEEKGLPDITPEGIADGKKDIIADVDMEKFIIVPYSGRNLTGYPNAKSALNAAHGDLAGAASLNDICPGLDKKADEIVKGATAKDLSVTDIFYVDYVGKGADIENSEYIVLTVDLSKYSSKYEHAFMVKTESGAWTLLDADHIRFSDDGATVYLYLKELGSTVAVLQMNDNVIVNTDETDKPVVPSPQTGLDSNSPAAYIIAGAAVLLVAAAVVVIVVAKKKKAQ